MVRGTDDHLNFVRLGKLHDLLVGGFVHHAECLELEARSGLSLVETELAGDSLVWKLALGKVGAELTQILDGGRRHAEHIGLGVGTVNRNNCHANAVGAGLALAGAVVATSRAKNIPLAVGAAGALGVFHRCIRTDTVVREASRLHVFCAFLEGFGVERLGLVLVGLDDDDRKAGCRRIRVLRVGNNLAFSTANDRENLAFDRQNRESQTGMRSQIVIGRVSALEVSRQMGGFFKKGNVAHSFLTGLKVMHGGIRRLLRVAD